MTKRIYGPPSQRPLFRSVAAILDLGVGDLLIDSYPDGERRVRFQDDLGGVDVILFFSSERPVDFSLFSLALAADAAKRAGARSVTALVPYLGYSRSDRIDRAGQPIASRVVADFLQQAGVEVLITLDLHNPAIAGFYSIPVHEGSAIKLLSRFFENADAVVVSPDAGGVKRASHFAGLLGLPMGAAFKERTLSLEARVLQLCGNFEGKEAIVVDDMIASGGTIEKVCQALREGGVTAIDVAATHPVMTPGAEERLRGLGIRRLVVTDSLPYESDWEAVEVVSCATLLSTLLARCL